MLPRTMAAMRSRAPDEIESLATALGTTPGRIQSRLQSLSGGRRRLRDLDPDPERLEAAVNAILARPDLASTPDPPDREELQALLKRAW
jgi:alcohol dehydrogenase class IV